MTVSNESEGQESDYRHFPMLPVLKAISGQKREVPLIPGKIPTASELASKAAESPLITQTEPLPPNNGQFALKAANDVIGN